MQPPPRPPLKPKLRLQLIVGTLTALMWLAVACFNAMGVETSAWRRQRHAAFRRMARQAALLIFLRAAELLGRHRYERTPARYGEKRLRRQQLRAVVGCALRRKLRCRDPLSRVALLIDAFNRIDIHAGALARRLRAGLSRAWGEAPLPHAAEALVALCISASLASDTS
ncbi:hypothetical protein [Terricaulis sp.]|uniref:hypothetical protein n=1 Tax=Terricaulis sp. TaxID=2768686 RepID=UPI003784A158